MLEDAYGTDSVCTTPDAVQELERGWFNAVYAARLRDGREVVLKIAPLRRTPVLTYELNAMQNETTVLGLLADRAGLPVPRLHHVDTTMSLVDAPWFTMSRIPGRNLGEVMDEKTLTPVDEAARIRELGVLNRRLNDIRGPGFGHVGGVLHETWRGAFSLLIADLLGDAVRAGVDLGVEPGRITAVVDAHGAALDVIRTPRFVAWDLWPGNALAEEGRITGLVDHERALWGDPLMEAAFMNNEVPIFPCAEEFAAGYGALPNDGTAPVRRRLYSLHLLLIMTIEPAFRGPQDPGQALWSRGLLAGVLASLEEGAPPLAP
ncbi:phosphotransferase family protein [Microbacterium gorillae]|uniref:phosphotransferase family protein n=1 Tax=Microbacterium gorillae TaxID=1231063 RepID=UPI000B1D0479|nr:aminoglycoside phosphotransferase family protein [Microbacterium gorillae]